MSKSEATNHHPKNSKLTPAAVKVQYQQIDFKMKNNHQKIANLVKKRDKVLIETQKTRAKVNKPRQILNSDQNK